VPDQRRNTGGKYDSGRRPNRSTAPAARCRSTLPRNKIGPSTRCAPAHYQASTSAARTRVKCRLQRGPRVGRLVRRQGRHALARRNRRQANAFKNARNLGPKIAGRHGLCRLGRSCRRRYHCRTRMNSVAGFEHDMRHAVRVQRQRLAVVRRRILFAGEPLELAQAPGNRDVHRAAIVIARVGRAAGIHQRRAALEATQVNTVLIRFPLRAIDRCTEPARIACPGEIEFVEPHADLWL